MGASKKQPLNEKISNFNQALRDTPHAFRLIWQAGKRTALISFILTPLLALIPAAQAWAGKLIVDSIVQVIAQGLTPAEGFRQTLPFLLLEFGLILLSSILSQLRAFSSQNLRMLISNHVSQLIMEKANSLDLQYFEDPVYYDSLQNARRMADTAALNIMNAVLQVIQQLITLASVMALLLRYSPLLALVVLIAAIPSFISQSQFAERGFRMISRRAPETRLLNYLEHLVTGSESIKEVRLFGLGDSFIKKYRQLFQNFYQEDRQLAHRRTLSSLFWGLLSSLVYYGSYAWVILRAVSGAITLGDLTMFLSIFRQSQSSVRGVLDSFNSMYESNLYLNNLLSFLALQPVLPIACPGVTVPNPIQIGFVFEDVSFTYPGSDSPVLHHINLHIKPQERIALVGLNGAGKTTLIKLLTRLYDPTQGRILLDGIDLREYNLDDLHSHIGVIFQDFVRYQFTVRENIGFGQVDQVDNLDQIFQAAHRGGAAEFIETLTNGYETILGRRWERGAELSGGQWQKIALSRAFMRRAQVMVLDEPTAALDAQAEYEVFQHFGELMRGRIAVLISHRFSTVRMADTIVVLSDGKIVEIGSHDQLMADNGTYAQLFNLQAQGYR